MINLVMAGLWLILGAALIGWQWTHPEIHNLRIWGWEASARLWWFALILTIYNLVRWWTSHSFTRQIGAEEESKGRLENSRSIEEAEVADPTFSFTGEPPHSDR